MFAGVCTINEDAIPDGVIISGRKNTNVYEEGEILTIGCSGEQLLNANVNTISCLSGEIWRPDYRALRCM